MALAINNGNGLPRVDIESLLWEMRDLLRGLSQVNKAQSVEIERLGGSPVNNVVLTEYDERAQSAMRAVDDALDQLDGAHSFDDATSQYEPLDVAAWIAATNETLGLTKVAFASDSEPSLPVAAGAPADVPNDFWDVHEFKWEDEPEEEAAPVLGVVQAQYARAFEHGQDDTEIDTQYDDDDDDLSPSDSITERALDDYDNDQDDEDESDSSSSSSSPHSSSNDDSATLYHPSENDDAVMRAVERHAFITGKRIQPHSLFSGLSSKLAFSASGGHFASSPQSHHLHHHLPVTLSAIL
jgi:hypothetical protein